jgi:hypothetical protein
MLFLILVVPVQLEMEKAYELNGANPFHCLTEL